MNPSGEPLRFVRACVRAVWLLSGTRSQKNVLPFSIFPFGSGHHLSLFSFFLNEFSLFPYVSDV